MLRVYRLAWHKNNLIIDDFEVVESFAPHKNNLIIDDFEVLGGLCLAQNSLDHF